MPQISNHNIIFLLVLYTVTTLIKKRMSEKEDPKVVRTWRNNKVSGTILLTLPHDLAKKHGIGVHTNLLAIDTTEGILLKGSEVVK